MSALFLVTGLGRSGTTFAHKLFTKLGHPCLHEHQYSPVNHGPLVRSESSWLAVPFLDQVPETVPVLRVIRNPYLIVRSAYQRAFLTEVEHHPHAAFVAKHAPPVTAPEDHLARCIRWVALWDEPMDHRYTPLMRVDGSALHLASAVGAAIRRPVTDDVVGRMAARLGNQVNTNDPALKLGGPTREDIDRHPDGALIRERAERFGYL